MKDNIKLELNYSLREHLFPTIKAQITTFNGLFEPIKVHSVQPLELFGSKLTALMGRAAARDLYDSWHMVQNKLFVDKNLQQLKKSVVFYSILNSDSKAELFNIVHLKTIDKRKIHRDLRPVVYTKENIQSEDLVATVAQFLRKLLILTEDEHLFVNQFYDEHIYKPELLFEDKDLVRRLQSHPMIMWKLKK